MTADLADNTVSTAKLGNLAVSADKIQNTAITTDKLANGSVTGVKIAQAGATNGQVLKWNSSTWGPGADLTGECLWSQSGSDIYFTGGKVRIGGTNLGNAWFQVKAGGNSEIARFESTAASNWIGMYTNGVRKGILWVNGDNLTLKQQFR